MTIKTKLCEKKKDLGQQVGISLRRAKAIGQYITGQSPSPDTRDHYPVMRGDMDHVRQKINEGVKQIVITAVKNLTLPPSLKKAAQKKVAKSQPVPKSKSLQVAKKATSPSRKAVAKKA